MKFCRFNDNRWGVIRDGRVHDVTNAASELETARHPYPRHDVLIESLPALIPHLEKLADVARAIPLSEVRLLSPVGNPGKIIAAPVNYTKHLEEVLAQKQLHHGNLINEIHKAGLFLKATSSLIGAGEKVRILNEHRRTDHEIELAVIIGKRCQHVKRADALSVVGGYAIGLDITIRGPEERSLRKSPDTYTVLGPWLVTPDEIPDPSALEFSLHVKGELRQTANTSELILGVPELIEFASAFYTLEPGDILLTGTPQGVAPIVAGDVMTARFDGIGTMDVAVEAAS